MFSAVKKEVLDFIQSNIDEIKKLPLKALVVSCHTINAIGLNLIKEQIGVPVIGISTIAKSQEKEYDPRKVLIIGTRLMIEHMTPSQILRGLGENDVVDMFPMQELVNYAEEFDFDSPTLKRYLKT